MILVKLIKEIIVFINRLIRFSFAFLYYTFRKWSLLIQNFPIFLKVQDIYSHRLVIYKKLQYVLNYYSEFVQIYSPIFWFRVVMLCMLYPLKFVFNSFLFPMFSTYFFSGAAFYIIFNMVCILIYLSILFPSFWQTLKQGDIYVLCVLQIIFVEATYSTPLTTYYCDPFILDSMIFLSRTYEAFSSDSKIPLLNIQNYEAWTAMWYEEEEKIGRRAILPYSELSPVPNEHAPDQLYTMVLDRPFRLYSFENHRYLNYFFRRHLRPLSAKRQRAFELDFGKFYGFIEDFDAQDRCLVWHSGATPFKDLHRYFGYHDRDWRSGWVAYLSKTPPRYGKRIFNYLKTEDLRVLPSYLVDLFYVPNKGDLAKIHSRRFERMVRESLITQIGQINEKYLTKIRTFFDAPSVYGPNSQKGFYVYLRAQKKLGGIHLSPVLTENNFANFSTSPGSSTYHYLFSSFEDYQNSKALKLLETWSAFYNERYPVQTVPLRELDVIFSNTRFLGLLVFFDTEDGERAFWGEGQRDEDFLGSRYFAMPSYLQSNLQRDFSPTYNLDILEFINRLPGFGEETNLLFQFSSMPDYLNSSLSRYPGFDLTSFKVLSMWGERGLLFAPFAQFNFYKKFVASQWYIFCKELIYDPITGVNYISLGTKVWTWGFSQRWIRDVRLVSVYTHHIGTGCRRVPYPTRFFIPHQHIRLHYPNRPIPPGVQYSRAAFPLEQFHLPYHLSKWAEPSPLTHYEVLQNGHFVRHVHDPRYELRWRHNSIVESMKFDQYAIESYAFMPRFFDSPFHSPYSFALRRSFDAYDWPVYMSKENKMYPRSAVKYRRLKLENREPWDRPLIYKLPGYHPLTPIVFVHPDLYRSFFLIQKIVARVSSMSYTAYDKIFEFGDWLASFGYYAHDRFNRRYLSYYIVSQVQWGKRGKVYHPFDLWWNNYLNREYGYQVGDVRTTLWDFRLAKFMGGRSMCYYQHHTNYYLKIANLLSSYFSEYGLSAPPYLHAKFQSASKSLNPPVRPYSAKIIGAKYPNMVPKVLFELQEILEGACNIMKAPRLRWSTAGPAHQAHIDKMMRKYPYERLKLQMDWLLKQKKKRNPRGTNQ